MIITDKINNFLVEIQEYVKANSWFDLNIDLSNNEITLSYSFKSDNVKFQKKYSPKEIELIRINAKEFVKIEIEDMHNFIKNYFNRAKEMDELKR